MVATDSCQDPKQSLLSQLPVKVQRERERGALVQREMQTLVFDRIYCLKNHVVCVEIYIVSVLEKAASLPQYLSPEEQGR
jgi:hypothetical protein